MTTTVALDDRGNTRAQIVHQASESRCATDSRTSAPRAYAGPTQDGQPVRQPQDSRCSRARVISGSYERKRRSENPIPPGVRSQAWLVRRSAFSDRSPVSRTSSTRSRYYIEFVFNASNIVLAAF